MRYEVQGECGSIETFGCEDMDEAVEEATEWVLDGSWGVDGAAVEITVREFDDDGQVVVERDVVVDVPPDHDALIRAAGGDPKCDHDWTSEGEGGCRENPGVWSVGGTAMVFRAHCRLCGLIKTERCTGSQRNPGEHDTVEYSLPDRWCQECESSECDCEV